MKLLQGIALFARKLPIWREIGRQSPISARKIAQSGRNRRGDDLLDLIQSRCDDRALEQYRTGVNGNHASIADARAARLRMK